jgi:hypothetical protein
LNIFKASSSLERKAFAMRWICFVSIVALSHVLFLFVLTDIQ